MLLLYRLIFLLIVMLGSPYLLVKAIWGKHGIRERLGIVPKRESRGRLFWFHAASVGELKVLAAVVPEVRKLIPGVEIAVSTTTATGKRRARQLFGDAIVFLQPLEINTAILRVIENLRPEKLILVETELWPLLINTAAQYKIDIYLVNARMSEKSFRIYSMFRTLVKPTLGEFSRILAQSPEDAARFEALGASHVETLGNTKYDQVLVENRAIPPALASPLDGRIVFVAGSIRRGEDAAFAKVIRAVMAEKLPVFFALAPRHMKDVDDLTGHLKEEGIDHQLWTKVRHGKVNCDVPMIVDTMGELTSFYRSAGLAFVGGSLVPIGGHDPTEPAALGVPVMFGPHMENAADAAKLLLDCGAAREVKDETDIIKAVRDALHDREALADWGSRGRDMIASLAGVSSKIARILAGVDA
jgi:3-deoxy-D-manno-octulosonic-acid transferase